MGGSRGQAAAQRRSHFSVDGTLLPGLCIPCLAGADRLGRRDPPPPPFRSWRGFWHSKAPQEAGQGGFPQQFKLKQQDPSLSVDPDGLAGPQSSNAQPRPTELQGTCSWTTAMPCIVDVASPKPRALENGMPAKRWRLTSPVPNQKNPFRADKELRHQGFCRRDAPHCRDAARRLQNTHPPHPALVGFRHHGRTARHEGYANQSIARRGHREVFGWIKQWAAAPVSPNIRSIGTGG